MLKNPSFIKALIDENILTQEDSERLNEKFGGNAGAILSYLAKGSVAKRDLLGKMWGDSLGIAYVPIAKTLIKPDAIKKIPENFARNNVMLPLYKLGDALTIAVANPTNTLALKEAERLAGCPVSPVFSFSDEIKDAIDINYQSDSGLSELVNRIAESALFKGTSTITEEQLKKLAGDQAVVEFVRNMLLLAMKERASDIHIEPEEEKVKIRFRIDGVLQERLKLDSRLLAPLVSRLKIIAKLDITEKRKPQDGRVSLELTTHSADFRFSSVPTIYGEKIVLRVLGQIKKKEVPDLSEMNFSTTVMKTLNRIIDSPNGVFFVTGPTGSGKTTTLYAVLKSLNKPGINIMTIEDPVEYRLTGVNQVQVNHTINLDFGSALRSFLRQDPDIILVGEIRDAETAKIASQAALTGHLVLTTMHTNNSLQAVTRLMEIGVEPFLVAPSIIGVMAQRLVRKICDNCKEPYNLSPEEVEDYFISDGKTEVVFYRGKGCEQCNGTGYSGRIPIHEIFIMNSEIRKLVSKGASILEIQERAKKTGYTTLRYDGMKKVLRGLTTVEELDRVTVVEEEL
ncbi:MAG: type II/IV secretion system protein [Nitrospirae bacterium]|nr:type II/IV secretion system protein [Nitrospirota bacterium]